MLNPKIKKFSELYRSTVFFIIVLMLLQSCSTTDSNLKQANATIQQFEQTNANEIIGKYQTNTFLYNAIEGCDSVDMKCYIFLLKDETIKMFQVYSNVRGSTAETIQEGYSGVNIGYWRPSHSRRIHINTLSCNSIKIGTPYIFYGEDNPSVAKGFRSNKELGNGDFTTIYYHEICLSADTLLIGYDRADKPVYLYKH